MPNKIKKVILLGPQGSGKSTQGLVISKYLRIKEISSGEVLRELMRRQTKLAKRIKSYINRGALLPNKYVNELIINKLQQPAFSRSFLLDGYPRNLNQAKTLDKYFLIDHVFNIDIFDGEAIKRLSSRLVCRNGHIFNTKSKSPKINGICDKCEQPLFVRDDDHKVAVLKRLKIYRQHTAKLLSYYKKSGRLVVFDGEQTIKKVSRDIISYLKKNAR